MGAQSRGTALGAVVVTLFFVVARAAYFRAGVRFDPSTIDYFAQLLDPALLRDRLGESLTYLHAQPPFYNLLVGIALKLEPDRPELILAPVFVLWGLYAVLCLYAIVVLLRVPTLVATIIASAIAASPLFILFENWCFYPHLNIGWLLGAGAWLARSRGRPGPALVVAGAHLVGLCLTRSLFHPLFFALASLGVVLVAERGTRRRALVCFAAPGILLVAICLKNVLLFDFFGTSSWASRNVFRAVAAAIGPERVQTEARRGRLSPAASLSAFEPGDRNVAAFGLEPRTTGIRALDEVTKSRSSVLPVNYNHWSYPASAHWYGKDALHLASSYPRTLVIGLLSVTVPRFFSAIDQDGFVLGNRRVIERAANAFDDFECSTAARWFVGLGLLLALLTAPSLETPRRSRALLALAFVALVWVSTVSVIGEYGENYRFRYNIVWLGWAVAICGYAAAVRLLAPVLERGRA